MSSPPLWTSFKFAIKGIITLVKTQRNARIHLGFTFAVIIAGIYCHLSKSEWISIVLAIGGVWMAESFNTAVEQLADTLHPHFHSGIGRAKDLAAAAVFLFAIAAAITGFLVFIPYALELFAS